VFKVLAGNPNKPPGPLQILQQERGIARVNQCILAEKSGISAQLSCKIAGKKDSKIRRKRD